MAAEMRFVRRAKGKARRGRMRFKGEYFGR
jgi:hypothetical protein